MINIDSSQLQLLRSCIRSTQEALVKRKGYSICDLLTVEEEADKDILTLLQKITGTTYLMGRHRASDVAFVHFTSSDTANKIKTEGFNFKGDCYSDYGDALCCFRIDAMSRGFGTPNIDTAVIFVYSGTYYSCIRQDDSNSNIGYQIIEKEDVRQDAIRILEVISTKEFYERKRCGPLNKGQILIHHGIPSTSQYENQLKNWNSLSQILPLIYEEYINSSDDTQGKTNLF